MPRIRFELVDGTVRDVEIATGTSVMLAAVRHNLPGLDGECGGCLSCATCHVYVTPPAGGALPPPDAMESELLDAVAAERRPDSRLGCQIHVDAGLDGLRVRMPARQS